MSTTTVNIDAKMVKELRDKTGKLERKPAEETSPVEMLLYVGGGFSVVIAITLGFAWILIQYYG